MIRDENPWQPTDPHSWQGNAHVRVWRTQPDQVIVVLSGRSAEYDLETVIPLLRAKYPDDKADFYFHRPTDWASLGCYAQLTQTADGTVTRTDIAGNTLAARLGPTFYATEDPDDDSTGWGGP
ncbi:hypothetical protein ACIQI8_31435 [Streptomyces sp. NPDC092369]|uniref:hypothetical protein n=1 Tax=Streptomyces sp. NPDC092369 TaxID=3366015 RepID=UPI0038187E78